MAPATKAAKKKLSTFVVDCSKPDDARAEKTLSRRGEAPSRAGDAAPSRPSVVASSLARVPSGVATSCARSRSRTRRRSLDGVASTASRPRVGSADVRGGFLFAFLFASRERGGDASAQSVSFARDARAVSVSPPSADPPRPDDDDRALTSRPRSTPRSYQCAG
eukprot:31103-Pelagococcus_subviridis.AAC.3